MKLFYFIALLISFFQMEKFVPYNYDKAWQKVEKARNEGLPESVMAVVDEILKNAKTDKQEMHQCKAAIFKAILTQELKEEGDPESLRWLKEYTDSQEGIVKSVLSSVLAEKMNEYSIGYLHELIGKTESGGIFDEKNLQTWDLGTFKKYATQYYLQSVKSTELQKYTNQSAKLILTELNTKNSQFRPNLYDVLIVRALDYFASESNLISQRQQAEVLENPNLWAISSEFTVTNFNLNSTPTSLDHFIDLSQKYEKYLATNKYETALINQQLSRNAQINAIYNGANKADLQKQMLENIANNYPKNEIIDEVKYKIAEWHINKSEGESDPIAKVNDIQLAKTICKGIVANSKNEIAKSSAHNMVVRIESPYLQLQTSRYWQPNTSTLGLVEYKNISKLYFKLIELKKESEESINQMNPEAKLKWLNNLATIQKWENALPKSTDHLAHKVELNLQKINLGNHVLMVSDQPKFDSGITQIVMLTGTNLALTQVQRYPQNPIFVVTNRTTGEPQLKLKAKLYETSYDYKTRKPKVSLLKETLTDDQGRLFIDPYSGPKTGGRKWVVSKGDDSISSDFYANEQTIYNPTTEAYYSFTDRAIYRPGQKVYFKVIGLTHKDRLPSINSTGKAEVKVLDANQQEVFSVQKSLNQYGSCHGELILPEGKLGGVYSILVNGNYTSNIQVEEYKRPTFRILWDTIREANSLGDKIKVTGKALAYTGFPISNAVVEFRVNKNENLRPYYWFYCKYPYRPSPPEVILTGSAKSNDEGLFTIEFPTKKLSPANQNFIINNYQIEAIVTDINGESQSNVKSINIRQQGFYFEMIAEEKINMQEFKSLGISAKNLENIEQNPEIKVTLSRLKAPSEWKRSRSWGITDVSMMDKNEFEREFPHDEYIGEAGPLSWPVLEKKEYIGTVTEVNKRINTDQLVEGFHYLVHIEGKDLQGNLVVFDRNFEVENEKIPSLLPNELFKIKTNKKSYRPGEICIFTITTNTPGYVFFQLERQDQPIESFWKKIDKTTTYHVAITDKDKGNIHLHLSSNIFNQFYLKTHTIEVPWYDKKLEYEWIQFRDKTMPGSDQEWVLKIKGPDAQNVATEFMGTLYDASLDNFMEHNWAWNIFDTYEPNLMTNSHHFGLSYGNWLTQQPSNYINPPYRPDINLNLFNYHLQRRMMRRGGMMETAAVPQAAKMKTEGDAMNDKSEEAPPALSEINAPLHTNTAEIVPRENLNETVFFFPEIISNQAGEVHLKFKMGEALTQWKFLGLGYTKSLQSCIVEATTITQKDLMVTPNFPRFLRQGDKIILTSKVSNASESPVTATVNLQMKLDNQEVTNQFCSSPIDKKVTIPSHQSVNVDWEVTVPESAIGLLKVSCVASDGVIGDGEMHELPILTDKVLITETMPLFLKSNEKKNFVFTDFVQKYGKVQDLQYTFEYTANPVWHVIQSLPYLSNAENDGTEALVNQMTANLIGKYLVQNTPKLQAYFKKWQEQGQLQSNLNKNQELKSALLEETPWVLEAKSETEQMERIALLFDLSKLSNNLQKDWTQLASRQFEHGALPWFNGMKPNPWVSIYALEQLGRWKKMDLLKNEALPGYDDFVQKIANYVGQEMTERYEIKKKQFGNNKKWESVKQYDDLDLLSLFAFSFHEKIKLTAATQSLSKKYFIQMKKWIQEESIISQGMIVTILGRSGDKSLVPKMVASWRERAIKNPDLGMYWKWKYESNYAYSNIESQAFMIDVFDEWAKNTDEIDLMKYYLLTQKQTNRWHNSKATASAIFAFWQKGTAWQNSELKEPIISFSKKPFHFENGTTPPAYQKTTFKSNQINADLGKIEIENPNNNPAWGAAYYQYFDKIKDISQSNGTQLKIKKYFIKKVGDKTGVAGEALDASTKLKPGDRIAVRLECHADRDYSFIHIKDLKPSGFDHIDVISKYHHLGGLGYYKNPRDLAMHFYIDYMPKGSYVLEYELKITHKGTYSQGFATIQSMYAPEFSGHSLGGILEVKTD